MSIKLKNQIFVLYIFLHVLCFGFAEPLQKLLDQHKQTRTRFSILAVDVKTGQDVYRLHADRPMMPASNMKIITTAAALHYLGGQYTFRTSVGMLGKDLVIVGGGDPLLADPKHDAQPAQAAEALMDMVVSALKKADILQIENLIADASFFDNQTVHPSWPVEQLNQWYACEVSGLNFYDNCIHLDITRQGNRAVLNMIPENKYVHLLNQLQLVSSGSSAVGAYRNSVPNKLTIKGRLNQSAGFDVAIENPAGFFASVLRDRLEAAGISMQGQVLQKSAKNDDQLRYLIIFETPIDKVLKRSNTDSLGLAAECLVKTLSAENTKGNMNGQWSHGLELISKYLGTLQVPQEQFVLDDGCGLSRNNRLSTECLIAVLKDMCNGPYADVFTASLAVGGVDGTIGKYFQQAPYKGNILGKTGYIAGVRSFSGICKTPRGDILFSILTENGNGYTRSCINDITEAIYDGTL